MATLHALSSVEDELRSDLNVQIYDNPPGSQPLQQMEEDAVEQQDQGIHQQGAAMNQLRPSQRAGMHSDDQLINSTPLRSLDIDSKSISSVRRRGRSLLGGRRTNRIQPLPEDTEMQPIIDNHEGGAHRDEQEEDREFLVSPHGEHTGYDHHHPQVDQRIEEGDRMHNAYIGEEQGGAGDVQDSIAVQEARMMETLHTLPQKTNPLKSKLKFREDALKYLGTDRLHQRGSKIRCCENLRHIRWPKWKNRIKSILAYRLWTGHLKEVEGHFGSSVVSYFIFLRWLCFINLLVFLLWFCVVCVPQVVVSIIYANNDQLCAFQQEASQNITCSGQPDSRYSVYEDPPQSCYTFTINECLINNDGVAYRQNKLSVITVHKNCSGAEPLADSEIIECHIKQAHFEWYEYILDFVTGSGIYNQTILFYGAYSYEPLGFFQFDVAFIIMVGLIYIFSIILLVYKMGHAYNESYIGIIARRGKFNFSNRVYSAWDFNIIGGNTAKLRKAYNRTTFLEEYKDSAANKTKWTWKNYLLIGFIRFWTNIFVLVLLGGAGAAIYFSTDGQLKLQESLKPDSDNTADKILFILVGYITSVVISVLNAVYPLLFGLIAKLELYKSATTRVSMTLIRTILVRLSSLLLLLTSLYEVITDCNPSTTTQLDYNSTDDTCSFATVTRKFTDDDSNDMSECPECWETYIGQQFFKLALLNMGITLGGTLLIETGRNFLAYCVKRFERNDIAQYLGKVVQRGHFNIPKSILDLIYTQTLMWLGFLFSPLLPLIVLVTSLMLFYVKKYSLMYNLDPDRKSFAKSAKTNFLFLFLMLLALFASIIPVFFAATQLKPSETCGPFRGLTTMYQAISNVINGWPCEVQVAIDFFNSAAFVIPFITFLLLALYALYVALQAKNEQHKIMKKQLQLEGADVRHLLDNQQASNPIAHATNDTTAHQQPTNVAIDPATAHHRSSIVVETTL